MTAKGMHTQGITLLGMGPGDPNLLTRQAWQWLESIDEIYVRTRQHPTVEGFPVNLKVNSFDDLYEQGEYFEAVYAQIVERVLELGRRPQGVTYAVPGHPFVAEATGPEIARRAAQEGIAVQVIEGISFLEPVFSALGIDPYPAMAMVDGMELASLHVPPFPPNQPALIAQVYSRQIAAEVKLTLNSLYPDQHRVRLVHGAGTPDVRVEDLALYEIDRSKHVGLLTALYVPPLEHESSLEAFQEIVAHLRAPDGCPWDREQTLASLTPHLVEESYEALDALDEGNLEGLREELGDVLMNVMMLAQIASEEGEFSLSDVVAGIHRKIVYRHPHVFGEVEVADSAGVLKNWEALKEQERKDQGKSKTKGMLDGLPKALPALSQAQEFQSRAARVGFDWPNLEGVLDKLMEEWAELKGASSEEERQKELGDLLFSMVNLVRWYKADAESLLRRTNQRFKQRFAHIEQAAREQDRKLAEMSLDEMEALWQEAKRKE